MPELSATQLVEQYVGKFASWAIHRPGGTVWIPSVIKDVKSEYGRIRLLIQIRGTQQATWVDSDSLSLERKE